MPSAMHRPAQLASANLCAFWRGYTQTVSCAIPKRMMPTALPHHRWFRLLERARLVVTLAFDALIAATLISIAFASRAYAGDAPPAPDVDAAAWAKALYEAITAKHWTVVVGVVLIGIVYPIRRFGPDVLKTPFGGLVLAFAVSLAGSLGISLAAGAAFSWSLALGALTTAATAAGVWEWAKAHVPGAQAVADKSSTPAPLPTATIVQR